MSKLDWENSLSDRLGEATDAVGTKLGEELDGDPKAPPDSFQVISASESDTDSLSAAFLLSIRERLERHSHFRGRTSLFSIELVEGTIVLSGRLPSHYLKQLLQEAVRLVPGVVDIDNRVLVMRPSQ